MARQNCSACRKVIEVDPPVCPACGAGQPEAAHGALGRALVRAAAALVCALAAAGVTRFVRPPMRESGDKPGPAVARLKEKLPALKADASRPFTLLEDAMADPARYADKPATVLVKFSGNTGPETANIHGLGVLASFDMKGPASVMPTDCHEWALVRGWWRRGGVHASHPLHLEAESVETLGDAQERPLAEVLGVND